jgi:hypothetical protein
MTQADTLAPDTTAEQAPVQEAPAPPQQEATPPARQDGAPDGFVRDATGAYERYILTSDQPAEETKEAEPEPEAKAEEQPDELDRLLSDPKVKKKLDDMVNGRLGSRLEQERKRIQEQLEREIRQKEQQWSEASQYYQRLLEDVDFADEQERQFGRQAIEEFKRNYELAYQARVAQADPVIRNAVAAEVVNEFNNAAISEFKEVVQSLPVWDNLPADVKETIASLQATPEGGWFNEGMKALGVGIAKMLERINDEHRRALEEAREAGMNEAVARREQVRPIVVNGKIETADDAQRVIYEYGLGIGSWTREDFNRARKMLRQDF